MIILRPAEMTEADAIARFHVRVWRHTYRNIAPPKAFELLDETRRRPVWQATLDAAATDGGVWIAIDDDQILGLISFGKPGAPAFGNRGEIKHLYVDPSQRGKGLGTRLMAVAFQGLRTAGFGRAGLAVVRQNLAARQFYAAMGGVEVGSFTDAGPFWKSDNVMVDWDLGNLPAPCSGA